MQVQPTKNKKQKEFEEGYATYEPLDIAQDKTGDAQKMEGQ